MRFSHIIAVGIFLLWGTAVAAQPGTNAQTDPIREELKKIEREIEALKEKIIEMKSQLLILSEMFEKGTETGTMLSINVENRLPKNYRVSALNVFVNGYQVYSADNPDLKEKKNIYLESVAPGNFRIEVVAEIRGKGGLFKKKKSIAINGSEIVPVDKGLTSEITIVFAEVKKKPVIKFSTLKKQTLPAVR